MSEPSDRLDDALERVVTAARAHLAAVRAAAGAGDDPRVWRSYVALNNLCAAYDRLLREEFGEATPWQTEPIEEGQEPVPATPVTGTDPYPAVLSVRQRRDYRVPSTGALLAAASAAVGRSALGGEPPRPPATVADAVLALIGAGDGSLAALEAPELEPVGGVVVVSERATVAPSADVAAEALFAVDPAERLLGRLDEQPYPDPAGPAAAQ